jgi:hypothetical protein
LARDTGATLIVSVPYPWRAADETGHSRGHLHGPIDDEKLAGWVGRFRGDARSREGVESIERLLVAAEFDRPPPLG